MKTFFVRWRKSIFSSYIQTYPKASSGAQTHMSQLKDLHNNHLPRIQKYPCGLHWYLYFVAVANKVHKGGKWRVNVASVVHIHFLLSFPNPRVQAVPTQANFCLVTTNPSYFRFFNQFFPDIDLTFLSRSIVILENIIKYIMLTWQL